MGESPGAEEPPPGESTADSDGVVVIDSTGDLLLRVSNSALSTSSISTYRVSSKALAGCSPYFSALLHPEKFREGIQIRKEAQELKNRGRELNVLANILPTVCLGDVGILPARVSNKDAFAHFLQLLHGSAFVDRKLTAFHIGCLAVIADRFDAVEVVASSIRRQGLDRRAWKENRKKGRLSKREIPCRQRLFAGIVFGFPEWVLTTSHLLVVDGSERWREDDSAGSRHGSGWGDFLENKQMDEDVQWMHLPGELEG
jgi:hypothetical protein